MVTDQIADMLIRIKNALAVKKPEVNVPLSKLKLSLAKLLKKQGLFKKVSKKKQERVIRIILKQDIIEDLKRASKPGCRIYVKAEDIRLNRISFSVISTSKGLMIDKKAKKLNLGGEILCLVSVKNQ